MNLLFDPPPESTQELVDAERSSLTRSLFTVAAVRLTVVSLLLVGLVMQLVLRGPTEDDVGAWRFVLIGVTYGLSVVYLLLLRVRRLVEPLAYVQIGLDGILVSALVFMTQGVESPFAFAYVFVVLSASMSLYRRGGLIAAATTVLMFGSILLVQLFSPFGGLVPLEGRWAGAVSSYVGHSAGMIVVALLASTLAEKLRATGQKLAEKELDLEHLAELHAAILRSLPAGVLTVDDAGFIQFANESAVVILEQGAERLVGRALGQAVPPMAPAWQRTRESLFRASGRERFEIDIQVRGEPRRVGFSVAPLSFDTGVSAIIVFQDVTDRVRLEDAVARSERLASVGQFAAGLAHEVRNPLASMCASIDVLSASLEPPPSMQRLMSNITKEAERLNALISDFLALARPRKLEVADIDGERLVASVVEMFENELQADIRVERHLHPIEVRVDEDLIRQVLWNLLRNARDALLVKGGGTVRVSTGEDVDGAFISVADDGDGIPEDVLPRVFDPFFTTKERGSGLGLAISNSIVEAHGGSLWVESRSAQGTTVIIRFGVLTSNLPLPEAVA
ncbi:MAG: ATP-binding protein [Myxococcota bacterium]